MPDAAVEAILAHGRRDFGGGSDLMRLYTRFGRAVHDAYLAGHADGSRGAADLADAERAWQRSKVRSNIQCQPAGLDIVGLIVVCDDPRSLGREAWRIVAVSKGQAWIVPAGQGDRVSLLVDLVTCRGVVSAQRLG